MITRLLALALILAPMFAQVDVPTRRNDNSRSGVNAHETNLTHDSVRTRFGKLWTLYADAKIMAQPLYVSNPPRSPAGKRLPYLCLFYEHSRDGPADPHEEAVGVRSTGRASETDRARKPKVNAIVTLVPEMAANAAAKADEMQAHKETFGQLHGLPVAHKDLLETHQSGCWRRQVRGRKRGAGVR